MITRFRLFVVGFAVVVLAIAAAACGDDDNDSNGGDVSAQLDSIQTTVDDLQANVDELVASSQRAHVLATMTTIRTEGLHEIDGEAQQASEIQAGWDGAFTRMAQAVGGTDWPDALSMDAADWHTKLVAAEEAIGSGDLSASKTAIAEAHAAWHMFEPGAYQYLAGEEVTGGDGEMDMDPSH
jgi:hypothetical protein